MSDKYEIIVIGGSWGGMKAAIKVLKGLPPNYELPILLVLHRLKGGVSGMVSIFQKEVMMRVKEVDDKESIVGGTLFIAPADYHTLIEKNRTFSLDVSEPVNYCRPSIDITFESAAEIFGNKTIAIILSGNNHDGSGGLLHIYRRGGQTIVQDPEESEAETMPLAAIKKVTGSKTMKLEEISILLQTI